MLDFPWSDGFDDLERLVLEYADAMTVTGHDVTDELFGRLRERFDDDALVELTATIAWENASSKFNRALRVPSQRLWTGGAHDEGAKTDGGGDVDEN